MKKFYYLLVFFLLISGAVQVSAQCVGSTSCQIQVMMHDSYGDGWNNGELLVYQGDSLRSTVTLSDGLSGNAVVTVCSDSITFVWTEGWYDGEVSFEVMDADGDTLLAMSGLNSLVSDTLATVAFQCPTCPRPFSIDVVSRTHDQLSLSWGSGTGTWLVEYGPAGFTQGTGTSQTVTTPAITLSGLDSAQWYDVYVTSVCGMENSSPRLGHFCTLCGTNTCEMLFVLIDYNWDGWNGDGIYVLQRGDTLGYLTLASGRIDTVFLPLCQDSVTLMWHQVNDYNESYIQVYDASRRLLVDVDMYEYADGDEIATVMNNCNICEYVNWVSASSIDSSQFTIYWPSTSAGNYVVGLNDNTTGSTTYFSTTDTFYTFTSLMPNHPYTAKVASLCGADTGVWSEVWVQTLAAWMPIIYVSTGGNNSNTGNSWSNALSSISDATSLANTLFWQYGSTPEIWVAEGSYNDNVYLCPGLHVYGGLAGNEPADYDMSLRDFAAHTTTITYSYNAVYQYNDFTSSTAAWVDGFTLTGSSYGVVSLRNYGQLRNCVITGNTMYNDVASADNSSLDSTMPPSFLNCIFENNTCSNGSYYILKLNKASAENCLFTGNEASVIVRLIDGSSLNFCDVVANNSQYSYYAAVNATTSATSSSSVLRNTIVWGNTRYGSTDNSVQVSGTLMAYNSAIQGGSVSGLDNITLDTANNGMISGAYYPQFVNPVSDFRLTEGSACIDAASGTPSVTTDLTGRPRVHGSAADIGCYEWQGEHFCNSVTSAQVFEVTSFSARVQWVAPLSNYTLYYAPQGSSAWDSVQVDADVQGVVDSVSGNRTCSVLLGGLSSLTSYVVRLRTICPDTVSDFYEMTFSTNCPSYVGQVLVGDTVNATTTSGGYFPTQTFYNYSATQQIYLSSELGSSVTLDQLGFFYTYANSTTRYLKIFLGHTSLNSFSSTSDVIPESQLTLVYSGSYTFSNSPRLNSIHFQVPFTYNGTDNLVLAVIDSTGSYQYSGDKFLTFSAPQRSLYYYRDGGYVDFTYPYFNITSYCNVIFVPGQCDSSACPTPVFNVTAGDTYAQVQWASSNTAVLEYRRTADAGYTSVPLDSNITLLSNLSPNSQYEIRMRTICGAGDSSQWVTSTFTTLPPNVSRLYVKSAPSGNGSGINWDNAMGDLESALQMAESVYQFYGTLCDIWVAEGTYYGDTSRTYAFNLVPGVHVYGGFAGNEPDNYDPTLRDPSLHPTILDGMGQRQVLYLGSSATRPRTTLVDGVVIQNGNSNSNYGGGCYIRYTTLSNSIVRNCQGYDGGGVYSYYSTLDNCQVYGNTSSNNGGGVRSYYGTLTACDIHDNTAGYNGGGVYVDHDMLTGSSIHNNNNTAGHNGGGVYDNNGSTLTNCLVYDNTSYYYGGFYGRYSNVNFCSIVRNISTSNSASVYAQYGNWQNSIIWGNRSTSGAADSPYINCPTLNHCAADFVLTGDSVLLLARSNFGSGDSLYVGFVSPADNDYRLSNMSAVIDRGSDTSAGLVDMLGRTRPYGNSPDMGCYEYYGEQFCIRPWQVQVSQINSFSALVTWQSIIDTVVVEYALASDSQWTAQNVVGDNILLNNLSSQTSYLLRVKSLCGNEYSDYSNIVQFTTACGTGGPGVTLGDPVVYNTSSGDVLPFNAFYRYSYTQTLFTAEELSGSAYLIDTLYFQYIDNSPITRSLDIYLGNTSVSYLSSSSSVPASNLNLVFSGSVTFNNDNTWFAIPLQQPFQYDGMHSLVIAVDDNTGSYTSSGNRFATHSTDYGKSIYVYSDYTDYTPSGSYSFNSTNYRLNFMLPNNCQDVNCPAPNVINIGMTPNSATFWTISMGGTLQMQYRDVVADQFIDIIPADTVVLTGLVHNRTYELRARTICSSGDTSEWTVSQFTLPVQNLQRLYVKATPSGLADGSSWSNAASDLNWAVATASAIHQTFGTRLQVWAAEGTYYGDTLASSAFSLLPGVDVYGGFQGYELASFDPAQRNISAHPTILSGRGERRVLYQSGSYSNADTACWDGFTLTAGRISNGNGGGAYVRQGGVLVNCTITNCKASSGGGGVYAYNTTIRNCVIQADSANFGGGIYGTYSTIEGCLIANNTAYDYGGIYNTYGSVYNCHIVSNLTTSSYYSQNYLSGSNIYNSVFWGNQGPGGYSSQTSYGNYHNCAFESIVPTTVSSSDCFTLTSENSGSVTSPLFMQPATGAGIQFANNCNWALQQGSVLIDRGVYDSLWTLPATDLSGNARMQNGTIDIGCYESSYPGLILPNYSDGIIYVTPTGAGLQDGSSWDNAMSNLSNAISYAQLSNYPDIWVAEGTYYGDTSSTTAFTMVPRVKVYGGFQGNEPASFDLSQRNFSAHSSILSGRNERRVLTQDNDFSLADSTCWDGFTLTAGRVSGGDGGGAYVRQGGVLANCTIVNCRASGYGGGVYADDGTLRNCVIQADSAHDGGGVNGYYITLANCLIANNTANYYGGISNGSGSIFNCHIVANQTGSNDYQNYLYGSTVRNCVFWGNQCTAEFVPQTESGFYYNCAFESAVPSQGSFSGSIVLDRANSGSINSPLFVQPAYGVGMEYANNCDWTLQQGSILIDHGAYDSTWALPSTDLSGNARQQGGAVDIGCYESPYSGFALPQYTDGIVYVTPTGAGLHDGTSWDNALDDINLAAQLSMMSNYPDIWVAQGTYYGNTTSTNAFTLYANVNLYGGFAGNEPANYDLSQRDFNLHPTILDAQHAGRVLYQSDVFSNLTVCDGFVLQNGMLTNGDGVGAYLNSRGRLRNCIVQNNVLIYASGYSQGIGVYAEGSNSASDTLVDKCIVRNNIYQTQDNPNEIIVQGGGIFASQTTIANSQIYGNNSGSGGGIYANYSNLYNTILGQNQANRAAGIYLNMSNNLYNCVVAQNTATDQYGGIYSYYSNSIYNSIVWGNKVNYLSNNIEGTNQVYNSAVEGGLTGGTNILDLAATNDGSSGTENYVRFTDPTQNDYHLHPASHCVDYGDSSYAHLLYDLDGNPRIIGANIDLGAYESETSTTCPSPLNLRALSITGTSATLAWTPQGTESQWLFTILAVDGSLDSNITLSDTSVTVTGLSLNRVYTCYVKANCGSEFSIRSPLLTITTLCDTSTLTPLSAFTNLLPADSSIEYNSTVNFSWSALPEATSYDLYVWKGDVMPATPSLAGITTNSISNFPLPNYNRGDYYHWIVVAWNECISRTSPVQTFRVNPYPDLHVTSITHSTPMANQPMTVTWTVTNDGEGSTPVGATWVDRIWIVTDVDVRVWDPNDQLGEMGTFDNLQDLDAGESYTNSATITIPEDFIGSYYLFVFSDQVDAYSINFSETGGIAPDPYTPSVTGIPYHYLKGHVHYGGSLAEVEENDNFFYKSITILPPPSADLRVTHVSHPINAFSNSNITISWTVANQGSAMVPNTSWYDDVYIQMGNELDLSQARRLAHVRHQGLLAVDSSYQASCSVHIPITYSGTYNIFVVTDNENDVYESIYESNNTTASQQQIDIVMSPLADLQVTNVTLPTSISPRCSYPVSWTVANNGLAPTELEYWKDALYLSPTATYDPATAIHLRNVGHYGVLAVDSHYVATTSITVPENASGSYYLLVKTDVNDSIFEYLNEDNNIGASSAAAQVLFPDLVVGSATFDTVVSVGQQQHVYAYIKNIGLGTAYGPMTTSFSNGTEIITKDAACNLAPGDSMLVACTLSQGCVNTPNGELTIVADSRNKIPEGTQNGNNIRTFDYFVPRVDLLASNLTFADSGWSGTQLPVTLVLINQGASALSDSLSLAAYVSNSPNSYTANEANRVLLFNEPLQIPANDSISLTCNALLPNGISGSYYLHLVVDPANKICESNESNNVLHSSASIYVNLSPYPDLVALNLTMPDTLSIGQTVQFAYDIVNQGLVSAQGSMNVKVFMSLGANYSTATLFEVASQRLTLDLAVDDTLAALSTGVVPTNVIAGFYYFYVVVDYADDFYEHTGESNNALRSSMKFVQIYPLDLAIDSLVGPDTVQWGQRVTYVATIRNNSNVVTAAPSWNDRLYISLDGSIQSNTPYQYLDHPTPLAAGASYQVSFDVTVPYGIDESFFLVAICDYNRSNPDITIANNQLAKEVFVNSVPTPDLQVSDLAVIGNVVSGQPFQLAYTVTNVSETPVAQQRWVDNISLSILPSVTSSNLQLCLNPVQRALASGGSYRDTVEVTIPLPNQGAYYLVVQANAQGNFYEVEQANNVAAQQVSVTLSPPGDLMVSTIVMPDTVVSGREASFQWTVTNVGSNEIAGRGLSSLIYLSSDDAFGSDDRLLGRVNTSQISLAPGDTLSQQLSARISGVTEGNHYIIAKTDVRNAFYEDNEDNNTTVSTLPFYVKLRELLFNTPLLDTLYNGEPNDYKLVVGSQRNETVRIHVESDDSLHSAVNSVYVSYNTVGTDLNYQLSTIGQYTANPELYIPATRSGFYGVSLYGSVPADSMQVVTVSADILPFELRGISPNYGGNDGSVTVELTGSRFRPDMKVWMLHQGDTIFADALIYSSYYKAFARFNLQGADTGLYSMGVLNYCEGEAMLVDVFHVTGPSPDGLGYHMVFPNSPRPNRNTIMMLEFGNTGNTDIQNAVLEVHSVGGTYIALTPEGLSQQQTVLRLPLTIEGQPEGLLRPGSYGSITIYGYTAGSLVFAIKQVQ